MASCEHSWGLAEPKVGTSAAVTLGGLIHGSSVQDRKIVFCFKCPLDLCTGRGTSLQLVLVPVLLVQD